MTDDLVRAQRAYDRIEPEEHRAAPWDPTVRLPSDSPDSCAFINPRPTGKIAISLYNAGGSTRVRLDQEDLQALIDKLTDALEKCDE
jgi:hypothetical protein